MATLGTVESYRLGSKSNNIALISKVSHEFITVAYQRLNMLSPPSVASEYAMLDADDSYLPQNSLLVVSLRSIQTVIC